MTDVKHGLQLFIRTPADTWANVITGVGQDPNLRSINIYDGKEWQTVSWGKLLRDEKGPTTNQLNSFQVYLPNIVWNNTKPDPNTPNGVFPIFNPNYVDLTKPFTPLKPNWVRLFYTWPRETKLRSPHWRIIPLFFKVPKKAPYTQIWDGLYGVGPSYASYDMGFFWPGGAKNSAIKTVRAEGGGAYPPKYSYPNEAFPPNWPKVFDQVHGVYVDQEFYVAAQSQAADAWAWSTDSSGLWDTIQAASMIDFEAIKTRLAHPSDNRWIQEESGADFVGQYDSSIDMTVKRVLLTGTVHTNYLIRKSTAFTGPPDPITHQIYVQRGQSGQLGFYNGWDTTGTGGVPLEQGVRYPTDPRPQGDLVFDHVGPDTWYEYSFPVYERSGSDSYPFSCIVENPGQDNVTFSASVLGYPPPIPNDMTPGPNPIPIQPDIIAFEIGVSLNVTRALVHLASPGFDTPFSTHQDFNATR